jgi:hypothetical protein
VLLFDRSRCGRLLPAESPTCLFAGADNPILFGREACWIVRFGFDSAAGRRRSRTGAAPLGGSVTESAPSATLATLEGQDVAAM